MTDPAWGPSYERESTMTMPGHPGPIDWTDQRPRIDPDMTGKK